MAFDVWRVVDPGAFRVMHDHVLSAPHTEVGGFLIGRHGEAHEPPAIEVAIEATAATGDLTHVTFTHEVWEDVHRVIDDEYPDYSIIGWYHSHPGHGIFLSEYDKFIQRNFFPAAWQVAIVIDPIARTEGFFAWARGEITLIAERAVGDTAFAPATSAARSAFTARLNQPVPVPAESRPRLVVTLDEPTEVPHPPAAPVSAPQPQPLSVPPPPSPARPAPPREPVAVPAAAYHAAAEAPSRYPVAGLALPAAAGFLLGALLGLLN